jgi:uracil-DNA glycosylase
MKVALEKSWKAVLNEEFKKPYFSELTKFVKNEYQTQTCYPPGNEIFAAFDHCPVGDLKVVILGQDPYHGPGQANGLCFSVRDSVKMPPSLVNIFREIEEDLDKSVPETGNLERWAKQGVLLLNTTLSVREFQAGSHQKKGWEKFTDQVIRKISEHNKDIVFMLWGSYAKQKEKLIDEKKHLILKSGHPSPLSANRGYWFGNKHFSKANAFLEENGLEGIEW